MNRHIDESFSQLLLCSIGKRSQLDAPISNEQWATVFILARKHALLGVIADAMMKLPPEQKPQRKDKVQLALLSNRIAYENTRLNTHLRDCADIFDGSGLNLCLLKGQGLALHYPNKLSRQSGDIDLWSDGGFEKTIAFLKKGGWKFKRLYKHHLGVVFFDDKTDVEVHFHPTWFNNPFKDRKLKRYFRDNYERQFSNFNEELGINICTSDFNCVYILIHIFRHFYDEGVGLRQLMDYYYVLINSSESDRREAMDRLRSFGLAKFTSALMWTMREIFELDEKYLLCNPDAKRGEILLEEIKLCGNMGKFDSRNDDDGKSMAHHFLRRQKRLATFLPLNASEVVWAPAFRIYQYFWRIAKGFRY